MRARTVVGGGLLLAASVVAAMAGLLLRGGAEASPLKTVDAALLWTTNAIRLEAPSDRQRAAARISREDAEKTASGADPDYVIRESALVQLARDGDESARATAVWAVSMAPPDGKLFLAMPPGCSEPVLKDVYYITFVDAVTGDLLFSAQGGREAQPSTCDPDAAGWKPAPPTPTGPPPHPR